MGQTASQRRAEERYQEARSLYNNSLNEYKNQALKFYNEAYDNTKGLVGEAGYNKALEMANAGARGAASQAMAQAQSGARLSGMNKAQAAQLGAQTGASSYLSALNNQQNIATQALNAEATNEYNKAGGVAGVYGNKLQGSGTLLNADMQNSAAQYAREEGNVGGILNKIFAS